MSWRWSIERKEKPKERTQNKRLGTTVGDTGPLTEEVPVPEIGTLGDTLNEDTPFLNDIFTSATEGPVTGFVMLTADIATINNTPIATDGVTDAQGGDFACKVHATIVRIPKSDFTHDYMGFLIST